MDWQPNLNGLLLAKGATRTDLLSATMVSGDFLIASQKLLVLLTASRLPPYRIYPVTIEHKGEILDNYKVLYFREPELWLSLNTEVRREATLAIAGAVPAKYRSSVLLNPIVGLEADTQDILMNELNERFPTGIRVITEVFKNFDFFMPEELLARMSNCFVSADLANQLFKAKCTGISLSGPFCLEEIP